MRQEMRLGPEKHCRHVPGTCCHRPNTNHPNQATCVGGQVNTVHQPRIQVAVRAAQPNPKGTEKVLVFTGAQGFAAPERFHCQSEMTCQLGLRSMQLECRVYQGKVPTGSQAMRSPRVPRLESEADLGNV